MTFFAEHLPWLISLGLMALALIFALKRQDALKTQLAACSQRLSELDRELAVVTERAAAGDTDHKRQLAEANQRHETLSSQHDRLRQDMDELAARHHDLQAEAASLTTRLQRLDELTLERDEARRQLNSLRQEKDKISRDYAAMQSKTDEERKSHQEKIQLLEQAEKKLTSEFENLANRIFEEKHVRFSQVSKANIEAMLTPMREQITSFRKRVDHVYDQENKERASLLTEIQQLKHLNERIGADALNLTKALKGDSKLRGNWGEMQLERLLEESGLDKGREYEIQVNLKNETGKRLQPDVVVHLPEKKDVVIDAKVSLVAYEQYHGANSDEERQRHIRNHITSLRHHVNSLSAKNYDELIGVNSLDLVIMFVPIEPALLLAFEHEPNLFSEAFNRKILLVSPSTLMATLQIIHNIWRYEHQNVNALKIATQAGRLYDQLVLFVDALEQVGSQLKKASDSYETAHKRLTSGRGNLIRRTEELKKLGAKAKKQIAGQLLEAAAVEDNEVAESELSEEAPPS